MKPDNMQHLGEAARSASGALGALGGASASDHWLRVAPDGCVHGSLLGACAEDASQAHAQFTPDAARRAQEAQGGWAIDYVGVKEWEERAQPCLRLRCHHR